MARQYSNGGGGGAAKLQDILKVKTQQFSQELGNASTKWGSQVEVGEGKGNFWSAKPSSSLIGGSSTTTNQMMEKRRNLKTATGGGSRTSHQPGMPSIARGNSDKPPIYQANSYGTNDRAKSAAVQNRANQQYFS
jgi:hypothetical protein